MNDQKNTAFSAYIRESVENGHWLLERAAGGVRLAGSQTSKCLMGSYFF